MKTTVSINRLTYLCDTIPALARAITDADLNSKAGPDNWSRKQILGHLIDSAANNQQRFIRVQFEHNPKILYDQNNWVAHNHYDALESEHVIRFWELYNRHLVEVIKHIPEENLERTCLTNEAEPVTLIWLIDDYVTHMEHHLLQILPGWESPATVH